MKKDYYPGIEYVWADDNSEEAIKARKEGEKKRQESEKIFDKTKINDVSMKLIQYSGQDEYYVEFPLLTADGDETNRWVKASADLEKAKKIFEEAKKIALDEPLEESGLDKKHDVDIYEKNFSVSMKLLRYVKGF